jgi:hypothetical protein
MLVNELCDALLAMRSLGAPAGSCGFIAIPSEKLVAKPRNRIGQQATKRRSRRLQLPLGHRAQQVDLADNARRTPVAHNGHPLDPKFHEQAGDLACVGLLTDLNDRGRDYVAGGAFRPR